MSPTAFEPAIAARQRPQTLALDSVAAGIGHRPTHSGQIS